MSLGGIQTFLGWLGKPKRQDLFGWQGSKGPIRRTRLFDLNLKLQMTETKILTTYISNPFLRLKAFLKPPMFGEKTGKGKIASYSNIPRFTLSLH